MGAMVKITVATVPATIAARHKYVFILYLLSREVGVEVAA
jgi:hypothetical protein